MRHGGNALIDHLAVESVSSVFLVPGESFLAALDALADAPQIRTVICRHEGGAAMMAAAWGRLTGRPGIALATRAPGAANALSGVVVAQADEAPMILFVGLAPSTTEQRGAFQEIDLEGLFSPVAKWVGVVRETARIPEFVARAFATAVAGRPGPVVLGLPENVLSGEARPDNARPAATARALAGDEDVEGLATALAGAARPLMIVGGRGWSAKTAAAVEAFATHFDLPVAAAFRCQDYVDNRHACYVGHAGLTTEPELAAAIRDADLVIALGTRLDEITTGGYALLGAKGHRPRLVHVSPDAGGLGRVFHAEVPIVATSESFAVRLAALPAPPHAPWAALRRDLRAAFERWRTPLPGPGEVQLGEVVRALSEALPDDAIVTNGAVNFAAFVHRHFCYKRFGTQLAPASGSMGYGLPAAVAAKLARPDRPVVAVAGDGCFMMTAQELATAVQYGLAVTVIVVDNGMYGTIRMHQERAYPGRVIGTSLVNPDFAALARSFGAEAETVARTAEFGPALERALAAGRPALIHVKVDAEAIAPGRSLSSIARAASGGRDDA